MLLPLAFAAVSLVALAGVAGFLAAALHTAWCYHQTPVSRCVICLEHLRAASACSVCEARMHLACQREHLRRGTRRGECPVCRGRLHELPHPKRP